MGAISYCYSCKHRHVQEWNDRNEECRGCRKWCPDNEEWEGWYNYTPITHMDQIERLSELDISEVAELLAEIGGCKRTAEEWEEWLDKPIYEH